MEELKLAKTMTDWYHKMAKDDFEDYHWANYRLVWGLRDVLSEKKFKIFLETMREYSQDKYGDPDILEG